MPVILDERDWSTWLDPSISDRAELTALMISAPPTSITLRPVSTRVNSVRNNDPSLLDRPIGWACLNYQEPKGLHGFEEQLYFEGLRGMKALRAAA